MNWQEELESIRKADPNGILHPDAVVAFARNPKTALHARFTWDDTDAARRYRIIQARELIRVCVTVVNDNRPPVRAYVSIIDDRVANGGYRSTIEAMGDANMREKVLATARVEMSAFLKRYEELTELERVFEAMREFVEV